MPKGPEGPFVYLERVKGIQLLLGSRINTSFRQFDLFFTPTFSPPPPVLFLLRFKALLAAPVPTKNPHLSKRVLVGII
jgi:hypothetical protein